MADDFNNINISKTTYQPGSLQVSVKPVSGASGSMYCWVGGTQYSVKTGSSNVISMSRTLTPDSTISCQVAWTCGGAIGPKSSPASILTYEVEIQYVQYSDMPDAPQVEIGWNAPDNYVGDFLVTLTLDGQAPVTATASLSPCVIALQQPLESDGNTVAVQTYGVANGASSYGPAATSPILVG